jgi:signal transduction histidine kinase
MEAFTSSGNVHALGNLITPFPTLLGMLAKQTPKTLEEYEEFVAFYKDNITPMLPRLAEMREIIETLHEPWNYQPAKDAMLHACVSRAIDKGVSRILRDNQLSSNFVIIDNKLDNMLIPVTIATSSDMLTQAFAVILQNSVEAIIEYNRQKQRAGKIEIKCELTHINDEPAVELLFKDNGIGMKKEVLRRIYELGWTTKSGHRGFGLLWAHDYLEGLGGRIRVISHYGKETWVQIILPANYIYPTDAR